MEENIKTQESLVETDKGSYNKGVNNIEFQKAQEAMKSLEDKLKVRKMLRDKYQTFMEGNYGSKDDRY